MNRSNWQSRRRRRRNLQQNPWFEHCNSSERQVCLDWGAGSGQRRLALSARHVSHTRVLCYVLCPHDESEVGHEETAAASSPLLCEWWSMATLFSFQSGYGFWPEYQP
jgi:hypothetical protein